MHSVLPELPTALLLSDRNQRPQEHLLTTGRHTPCQRYQASHAKHVDIGKGGPTSPPPSRAQHPRKLFPQSSSWNPSLSYITTVDAQSRQLQRRQQPGVRVPTTFHLRVHSNPQGKRSQTCRYGGTPWRPQGTRADPPLPSPSPPDRFSVSQGRCVSGVSGPMPLTCTRGHLEEEEATEKGGREGR